MNIIVLKAVLSIFLLFIFWLLLDNPRFRFLIEKRHFISLLFSFLLFRILPFIFIYGILNMPAQSDVEAFYFQANQAIQFKKVYTEFESFYAPLFPYLIAIPLFFHNSGKSIIFFMIIIEFVAAIGTYHYFKQEDNAKKYSVLYFLLPAPLVFTVLGGQEDVWMWLFIAWGLLAAKKFKNEIYLGVFVGLAFLCTKIIIIIFLIPVLFSIVNKKNLLTGIFLITIPAFVFFYWLVGNNIFMPLSESASIYPPNIWTVLFPLTSGNLPINHKSISFIGIGIGVLLSILLTQTKQLSFNSSKFKLVYIWIISYALMIIFSKKSLGNYLAIFMLPLLFTLNLKGMNLVLLLIINLVGVVQPSTWFRLGMPLYDSLDISLIFMAEYFLELVFVITLATIVYRITNQLQKT